jgi:putative ABC transport system permease protein
MFRVALRCLVHERGKLVAALAGVAFAASLVLAHMGMYVGFRGRATSVIARVGGDLWVMARGTELLDFADNLSAGTRSAVASHSCVASARGVIFTWTTVRKKSGAIDNVQIIGFEPGSERELPWSLEEGLPGDLHAPMRVAVDSGDLARLELPRAAIGSAIELGDHSAYVGAITHGIKSFTVVPYVFAEAKTVQRIVGLGAGRYTYWSLRLKDPSCKADVIASIERNPDLEVHTTDEFRDMTAEYWVVKSGMGATLAFSAMLALFVGAVVVGQTLFSMTEARLRELATLKAMGATDGELIAFVAWQAAAIAIVGSAAGGLFAILMKRGVEGAGVPMSLAPGVYAVGFGAVVLMCAVASAASVRKVLTTSAAEVFR